LLFGSRYRPICHLNTLVLVSLLRSGAVRRFFLFLSIPGYIGFVKPSKEDLRRYTDNFLREQDGIALYRALAKAERDPARADIFEKLAQAEERHAARWERLLKTNGVVIPAYAPGWRILMLGWLSRRFGTQHVLPVVTGL